MYGCIKYQLFTYSYSIFFLLDSIENTVFINHLNCYKTNIFLPLGNLGTFSYFMIINVYCEKKRVNMTIAYTATATELFFGSNKRGLNTHTLFATTAPALI